MRAEGHCAFVHRETGRFGRDLKAHAAGLAEIDRAEVVAIDHRRDAASGAQYLFAPGFLRRCVGRAKGDMMDRACADAARLQAGQALDDLRAGRVLGRIVLTM